MLSEKLIGTYVEIERKAIDDDALSGFVLDHTDELTLIHYVTQDYRLDGYCVIRNSDVTACDVYDRPDCFQNRVFRLRKIRPRRPRGVEISNWRSAFETAGKKFPLLVLNREAMQHDVIVVGRYVDSTPQTVTLVAISPTAEWLKKTRLRIADVTRLDFSGGYEDALWRVAEENGPVPQ
jgi:hypothetical protein